MLLNKHNLNIAALASKETSRFALSSLYVTPKATVETDGHQLIAVTLPEKPAADFPVHGDAVAVDTWKPFLLPAADAIAISKALPKKAFNDTLKCAAVMAETDVNGHSAIALPNVAFSQVVRAHKVDASFPDYERVIPKKDAAQFSIAFDAALLARVLKQIESFKTDDPKAVCTLHFTDNKSAVRIEATNGEGQELTAVVMPVRM